MATTPIQPGTSTGYQITYLPDGSLLVTQLEAVASGNVLEWDDEFAAAATGWSGTIDGVLSTSTTSVNGVLLANISEINGV